MKRKLYPQSEFWSTNEGDDIWDSPKTIPYYSPFTIITDFTSGTIADCLGVENALQYFCHPLNPLTKKRFIEWIATSHHRNRLITHYKSLRKRWKEEREFQSKMRGSWHIIDAPLAKQADESIVFRIETYGIRFIKNGLPKYLRHDFHRIQPFSSGYIPQPVQLIDQDGKILEEMTTMLVKDVAVSIMGKKGFFLTERNMDVYELLAQGLNNKEIASVLKIDKDTVRKDHRNEGIRKAKAEVGSGLTTAKAVVNYLKQEHIL